MFAASKGHGFLLAEAVRNFGHIGQFDRATAAKADLRLAKREGVGGVAKHANRLPRSGNLRLAARSVDILLAQHRVNLTGAYAQRLHFCRVKDDADFSVYPAIAADRGHAFNSEQTARNTIVNKPTELLQRHVAGFNREIGDWVAGCSDFENLRFQYAIG